MYEENLNGDITIHLETEQREIHLITPTMAFNTTVSMSFIGYIPYGGL